MYLSDRDIRWALDKGLLIIDPPPPKIDPTSVDLHLDNIQYAKIWDMRRYQSDQKDFGQRNPEIRLGEFNYQKIADTYLITPPESHQADPDDKVLRRGGEIIVKPGGFLLWQTKERVGTPETNPLYICFIDGKSTRARTGIIVHLTAPTIHGGWVGNVTLEIANLGGFTFVLEEGDAIAQITVATISSPPELTHLEAGSRTVQQQNVSGAPIIPRPAPPIPGG
jgi:dCTP deaminase